MRSEQHSQPLFEAPVVRLGRSSMLVAYISSGFAFGYMGMAGFLVPLRAKELGTPLELIGLLVGAASLPGLFVGVPSGALADRFGAKRIYIFGTAFSGLAALGLALTDNYPAMLALQLLRGVPQVLAWVAAMTYITGIGTPAERVKMMGRFTLATNLMAFLSPMVIGMVAQVAGYQAGFVFLAVFSFAFTALGLALPEVRTPASGAGPSSGSMVGFGTALDLLRLRGIQVVLLLSFVRIWNGSGWMAFYPLFLLARGFPPVLIGTVLSGSAAMSALTAPLAGRLTGLASKELVIAVSLGVGALGMALSPYVGMVPLVYLPAILMGTGVGVSLPLMLAILSEEASPARRGVAMGLRESTNQGTSTVAPVVAGIVVTFTEMALGFALIALVSWTVLGAALWRHAGAERDNRQLDAQASTSAGTVRRGTAE